jgi:Mg2+ and Co2+ transporter CorA
MPSSLFLPLDRFQPSEILSQYSEWVYFTLILIFFISVAGITLRKHFDKPYVKPLIISVGLMLTVGVFRFKEQLVKIFEGWGILGTILLVVMAATIPYGLCRGFGLSNPRAFFLTYILIYILSWVKFPGFYEALAEGNFGFVNLILLIVFFVALFNVFKPGKLFSFSKGDLVSNGPVRQEIDREMAVENQEREMVAEGAEKMTRIEFRTVEDIEKALSEIERIIEANRNNLPREERERMAGILNQISKDENIFRDSIRGLQKLFQRLDAVDAHHYHELKERVAKATGKEKKLLTAELEGQEEKIRLEKEIFEIERKLGQGLSSLHQLLRAAVERIKRSPYPYEAKGPLTQAKAVLNEILSLIKEAQALEDKLVGLVKAERKLLKKERNVV